MARYIDADRLIEWVKEFFPNDKYFISAIKNATTSDVKEAVRGEWIHRHIFGEDPIECSICGNSVNVFGYLFCPNCGADMREVD